MSVSEYEVHSAESCVGAICYPFGMCLPFSLETFFRVIFLALGKDGKSCWPSNNELARFFSFLYLHKMILIRHILGEGVEPTKGNPLLQVIMARSIGAGFILNQRDPSDRCVHAELALPVARLEHIWNMMTATRVNNTAFFCSGKCGKPHVAPEAQIAAACHARGNPTSLEDKVYYIHIRCYIRGMIPAALPRGLIIQTSGLHRSGKANCSTWVACVDATCSPALGTAL